MTLNLRDLSPHIYELASAMSMRADVRSVAQQRAVALLSQYHDDLDSLGLIARTENSGRLLAEPIEPLLTTHVAPPVPPDYTVIGVDGSGIDLDRHGLAAWYVVNVGSAVLSYGRSPDAELASLARIFDADGASLGGADDPPFGPGVELEPDMASTGRLVGTQGNLFDLRRTLAEQQYALSLARAHRGSRPLVVLFDGTLVIWHVGGTNNAQVNNVAHAYVAGLRGFSNDGLPLAGYISRPNTCEVAALLGTAWQYADGDHAEAAEIGGLADRLLFDWLKPGERSAVFASRARSMSVYGAEQRIHFYYLNVGSEIARVELPAWIFANPVLSDLVQSIIVWQCQASWGYPVALSEAHEQAIVRNAERETLLRMMAVALYEQGLPIAISEKQSSKNRRAV